MSKIVEDALNTIRVLSAEAIQKANSGHPGLPMGAAAIGYAVWMRHMRHNPSNPAWPNRDRFILSAGHGSMLLYSLLHLTGYDLSLEDIKDFRQWGSKTPGHPEYGVTPGVEVTTGPLGQGFANGVGMAVAERYMAEKFNTEQHDLIDHYTYALVSDGDLQEGVAAEAASYAGTQKLSKLIYLYDSNQVSIEGDTDVTFGEDVAARFKSYGWQVLGPVDGHDVDAVDVAIKQAKAETGKPSLIVCKTVIGFGAPNKAGSSGVHGAALGDEELVATKENLGWPLDKPFFVPDDALAHFREALAHGQQWEKQWSELKAAYTQAEPEKALELERVLAGSLRSEWADDIPRFSAEDKPMASRVASGKVLNAIFKNSRDLLGGSADLAPSNNSWLNESGRFGWDHAGHNMQFGIREHAMGSIAVGIAHHGGAIPYTATFLSFADYMRPPMRLAALSKQRVIFIFTHDSIGVGEDGPTHQPVEQVASLRLIPSLWVFRPADANETAAAWKLAIQREDGPSALVLTRQNLPNLDAASDGGVAQGAYTIVEAANNSPDVLLLATGSEVSLAIQAAEKLAEQSIQASVISMPCWELFDQQPADYQQALLPAGVPKVAVEAGSSMGWHRYIGQEGGLVTLDDFGHSGPGGLVMEKLGFNVDNVVTVAKQTIQQK